MAIIVFVFATLINAQSFDTVYVQLDSLKENPIRLDSVWHYHSGDYSTWALPEFDMSDCDSRERVRLYWKYFSLLSANKTDSNGDETGLP